MTEFKAFVVVLTYMHTHTHIFVRLSINTSYMMIPAFKIFNCTLGGVEYVTSISPEDFYA